MMALWPDAWRLSLPGPQTNLQVQKAGDGFLVEKEIEFTAATADELFEVTGVVALKIIGVCTERVKTYAENVSLGTEVETQALIGNTTAANLHTGNVGGLWVDTAPQTLSKIKDGAFDADMAIVSEDDIRVTSGTNVDAGKIKFYCYWKPISADGKVEAA